MSDRIVIDSAGTHAYHVGDPPDRRAAAAAARRGVSLNQLRARKVCDDDFDRFDYILAMDEDNVALLKEQSSPGHHAKVRLLLEFSPGSQREVPDPYYGGSSGFEHVLDLVEEASRGLLETLSR